MPSDSSHNTVRSETRRLDSCGPPTPAQRLEYAHRPEQAHHVVANRNNRRRFGKGRRPFDTEHARYGCADLIEAGTVRPGTVSPWRTTLAWISPGFVAHNSSAVRPFRSR